MSSSRSAEGSRGQIDAFAEPLGQFLDLFRSCLGTLFRRPCELQTDVTSRARLGATSRLDRSRPGDPELVNTVVNLMSTFSLLGRSRAVPGAEIGSKMPPLRSSFWTRRKVQNRAEKKMPQDKEYSSEKKNAPREGIHNAREALQGLPKVSGASRHPSLPHGSSGGRFEVVSAAFMNPSGPSESRASKYQGVLHVPEIGAEACAANLVTSLHYFEARPVPSQGAQEHVNTEVNSMSSFSRLGVGEKEEEEDRRNIATISRATN